MKRSSELTPLSRDHHKALSVALRLKRADDAGAAAELLSTFIAGHGGVHFRIEEEVLLPGWLERDPDADHELAARVSAEHLTLRTAARRAARGDLGLDDLQRAGALLDDHVRFEERILFPAIEAGVDPEGLTALGAEIAAAEAAAG